MLWWILGSACGGLVLVAVVVVVYLGRAEYNKKKRAIDEGEHTFGWLVQANNDLFQEGQWDLPALVLISPDEETNEDEEFMTDLAEKVMELKGVDPDDCDTEGDAVVAELMADETYVEGRRDRLPKAFAGGKKVYLAHIWVVRDHLPGRRIGKRKIPCAIIWDDPKAMVCTRPAPKRRRRPRDDDDDE
jgi:hypothetical protein